MMFETSYQPLQCLDPLFPSIEFGNSDRTFNSSYGQMPLADSDVAVVVPSLKESKKILKSKDDLQDQSEEFMDLPLRDVEIEELGSPLLGFVTQNSSPFSPAGSPPVVCQEQILTSEDDIGNHQFFVVDTSLDSPDSILFDGHHHSSIPSVPLSFAPPQQQQSPYIHVPQMPLGISPQQTMGIPLQQPVSVFGPTASPISSPALVYDDFIPSPFSTPISMTPVSPPMIYPSPPQSPVAVAKAAPPPPPPMPVIPLKASIKLTLVNGPPPVEKNQMESIYPQAPPPPQATRNLPPPPVEVRFAPQPQNLTNCYNNIENLFPYYHPAPPAIPMTSEMIPNVTRKRSASEISQDQKLKKRGKNSPALSNKRGKKHSNITIEEELFKALNEQTFSGVTPICHQGTNYPRYVVINEDKFYHYILSSRPEEYKLDKASLLEKFDKSRPCNRVNPKDRAGKVPIKYLRIDNRKKNPEAVKKEMTQIKSQYSKQKIRIITHRDWNVLPPEDFTYEIKQKK